MSSVSIPHRALRAGRTIFFCAALGAFDGARGAAPLITWCDTREVASGGGYRGPWRQNESRYTYVDDPTVALDARGAAVVAWVDQRGKDVFFQVYARDGRPRFEQPANVSRTADVFSWLPRIALSPQHREDIYVLWQEIVFSGGSHGGDIFFARSRDGGATFESPLNLSRSVAGDGKGRINREIWHNGSLDIATGPDGALYAAWSEYEGTLWFTRSTNRGASFGEPMQVAGSAAAPARAPALAVAPDGTVYVAWTVGERAAADVHLAFSRDRGRTFSAPRVVAETPGYSDAPKLAFDAQGTLHLVYAESAGGPFDRYHVRYTRTRDGGRTFEDARALTTLSDGASAAFPALSLDARNTVYVLWEVFPKHRGMPRGLAMAVSRDGGTTFSAPVAVPESRDAQGGVNGSQQGLLMRKLAVNAAGEVVIVNSSFRAGAQSRVWLTRAVLAQGPKC